MPSEKPSASLAEPSTPSGGGDLNWVAVLEHHARRFPDRVIARCGDRSVTHGEMVDRSPRVATGLAEEIERSRVSVVWMAPAMLRAVLDQPGIEERDLSSVRVLIAGGENIAGSEVERVLYEHAAVLEVP